MRFLLAAVASALALVSPVAVSGRRSVDLDASPSEAELENLFSSWMKQYSKTYSFSELSDRFMKFKANVAAIREHNAKGDASYQLGLNLFADLSAAEFDSKFMGFKRAEPQAARSNKLHRCMSSDVPSSIDWRTHGAVSPVQDQGQVGDEWSFAAAGAIEGAWVTQGNHSLVSVSTLELAQCCNAHSVDDDFKCAIQAGGVCSVYSTGQCSSCQRVVSISGYADIASGDEAGLLNAVGTIGPVAVVVEADQFGFQFYSGGVFAGTCGTQLNHGMLVVGYGTDNGQDYWIVKNSWGSSWGENGYIRIVRSQDKCGIANAASYPTV